MIFEENSAALQRSPSKAIYANRLRLLLHEDENTRIAPNFYYPRPRLARGAKWLRLLTIAEKWPEKNFRETDGRNLRKIRFFRKNAELNHKTAM